MTSGLLSLSAHITFKPETDCHMARLDLAELLEERFDIQHSTLQVEHQPERLLEIE